ncbi:condensation domain-containing protein, partial [Bacillus thuringiensis]
YNSVGKELASKIKRFSQQNQVTEYMIFLSAAMILLEKYSRQEDIVIGSPISARTHKDTENMLGMFVNTLAMRGKPKGQKTYKQF